MEEVSGKGRQSDWGSLRWAAEELPHMHRLWLLLYSLRSLLGSLVAHRKERLP